MYYFIPSKIIYKAESLRHTGTVFLLYEEQIEFNDHMLISQTEFLR